MAINATNEGGSYTPVDAGTYAARCYSMVHIGTIEEDYMGETKMLNKVRISWELPTELKVFDEAKGEQPSSISKEFTLSMNEKSNLRKFLESWRGKGFTEDEAKRFDITTLLGKPCMVSVIHKTSKKGKTYADISGVTTVPKGLAVPEQINKNFEFSYEPFDQDKFDSLPQFLKDKITKSEQFKSLSTPQEFEMSKNDEPTTDDLPF